MFDGFGAFRASQTPFVLVSPQCMRALDVPRDLRDLDLLLRSDFGLGHLLHGLGLLHLPFTRHEGRSREIPTCNE